MQALPFAFALTLAVLGSLLIVSLVRPSLAQVSPELVSGGASTVIPLRPILPAPEFAFDFDFDFSSGVPVPAVRQGSVISLAPSRVNAPANTPANALANALGGSVSGDPEQAGLEQLVGRNRALYELKIIPTGIDALDEKIAANAFLKRFEAQPPRTAAGLRRRVARDRTQLEKLLRSQGYYSGSVEIRIGQIKTDTRSSSTGSVRPAVVLETRPGPEFLVRNYTLRFADRQNQELSLVELGRDLGVEALTRIIGGPATSQAVVDSEAEILLVLANGGYPFARVLDRQVEVDHANADMQIQLTLNAGPRTRLGQISVAGLNRVNRAYIERQLGLEEGRFYAQAEIEAAKERLLGTGLFASVTYDRADLQDSDGTVPVLFEVRERDARQIRAGLSLSSLTGPSVFTELQHRNLFGEGQTAVARLEVASEEVTGRLSFRWPDILPNRIDLVSEIEASYSDSDQVLTKALSGETLLERRFNLDRTRISAGLGLEWLDERAGGTTNQDYLYLSAPIRLRSDLSNNRLDPTLGFKLDISARPTTDLRDDAIQFVSLDAKLAAYVPLPIQGMSLAAWGGAETILGEKVSNLPVSKRVFAGGQGSVRAFDREGISPRDASGEPTAAGGTSVLEGGIELRHRLSERLGYAAFAEAALASDEILPNKLDDPFIGVGAGGRFYSQLGPIRLDVGVPISEEFGWGDVQVNVGLGQAF